MRLVPDTDIILKALIKDSVVRDMLLRLGHDLFIREYAIEETRRHLDVVTAKSGLAEEETVSVLDTLLVKVKVAPAGKVASKLREAERVTSTIDAVDAPFVVAAMSDRCDGIWSDYKDLRRQKRVRVWTTREIAALSRV